MLTKTQSTADAFNQHWTVGRYNNDFDSSLRLAVEQEFEQGYVDTDLLRSHVPDLALRQAQALMLSLTKYVGRVLHVRKMNN